MRKSNLIIDFFAIFLIIFSLFELNKERKNLINKNDKFLKENNKLKNQLKKLNCFEYKKYLIKKESNIDIPNNISESLIDTILYYNKKYKLPNKIVFRLIYKESKFDLSLYKKKTECIGLYQIFPLNYKKYLKQFHLKNNINSEIKIGSYILFICYQKYKKWDLALSLYNSGKISYDKNNNPIIYNCKITKNYIKYILYEWNK